MRTARLRWKAKNLAACRAALRGQLVLAQIGPKRLGLGLVQIRLASTPGAAAFVFAHDAPRLKVACMARLPPWPLTMPTLALATWRSGSASLPRNCFTASVI